MTHIPATQNFPGNMHAYSICAWLLLQLMLYIIVQLHMFGPKCTTLLLLTHRVIKIKLVIYHIRRRRNSKNKKQRQKHNVRLAQNSNAAYGDDWANPDFNYDSNDSPEQPSTSQCSLTRHEGRVPQVKVFIGHKVVVAHIDTDAEVTLLSEACVPLGTEPPKNIGDT